MKTKKKKSLGKTRAGGKARVLRKKISTRRGSKRAGTKADKNTRLEKDEMFSGSIFDSTNPNTDALFVNNPVEIPEEQVKRPWWKKLFSIKNKFFSILIGLIFVGVFCTGVYVLATYGVDEKYPLGNTLNPTCTPGVSAFCTVTTPIPYTGAVADVNLGAYSLQLAGIKDNAGTPALSVDASNRSLYASDGTTENLTWDTGGQIELDNGVTITTSSGNDFTVYAPNKMYFHDANFEIILEHSTGMVKSGTYTASTNTIDLTNRILYADDGTTPLIDWSGDAETSLLSFNVADGDWGNDAVVIGGGELTFIDDSIYSGAFPTFYLSMDPINRILYASDGITPMLDYSGVSSTNGIFLAGAGNAGMTGDFNFMVGYRAGLVNTTGSDNNFIGNTAGFSNTEGVNNNFFGYYAGSLNTLGDFNNFFGSYASASNTTGDYNISLGYYAGYTNSTGSSNVFLGANAGRYETGSNSLYIDNQDRTNTAGDKAKALIYGVFDATAANQSLTINGNVKLSVVSAYDGTALKLCADGVTICKATSSRRYKEDILPLEDDWNKILQVTPVSFEYVGADNRSFGYIAENLDALGLKDLVIYDTEGRPDAIQYDKIPLYILEVVKQQQIDINTLKTKLGIEVEDMIINQAGSLDDGEVLGVVDQTVQASLVKMGASLIDGVLSIKEIIANKMTVETASVKYLQMTSTNGTNYCIWIDEAGDWQKAKGDCATAGPAVQTIVVPTETPSAPEAPSAPETTSAPEAPAQESVTPLPASPEPSETQEVKDKEKDKEKAVEEPVVEPAPENPLDGAGELIQESTSGLLKGVGNFFNWLIVNPIKYGF